ncbi:MAG: hypothetical protein JW894_03020 [Bacteroidales bacterium]|nr:hypothetical protein [Bacteroidales bacterium]
MTFFVNWNADGVIVKFEGTLTFDLIMKVNDFLTGNSQFDSILYQVWDFRKVTTVAITKEDAMPLAALAKSASRWTKKYWLLSW